MAASSASAHPNDKQVLKDITLPGVLKAKLKAGAIKKVWSSVDKQFYWDRACVVWRNANIPEFPKAMLEVGGFARYSYVTNTFQSFLTTYNTYTGIPAPTNAEIMKMLQSNLRAVLGEYKFSNIVGKLHYFRFPEHSGPVWENPKHLTVQVETEYERKEGPTWTVVYADRLKVHFYRDDINSPWRERTVTEEQESTRGARKEYSETSMTTLTPLERSPAPGKRAGARGARSAAKPATKPIAKRPGKRGSK